MRTFLIVSGSSSFDVLLRQRRLAAGLTQEELARLATVGVRTLRNLETGRVVRPQRSTVDLLATALGLGGAEREDFVAAARGTGALGQLPGRQPRPARVGWRGKPAWPKQPAKRPAGTRRMRLREAVAASWALLAPDEQLCLRRLAAIQGRWSLRMAEAALGAQPAGPAGRDVADLVQRLVAVGLVSVRPGGEDRRFWMLSAVRGFALAQAGASGPPPTPRGRLRDDRDQAGHARCR